MPGIGVLVAVGNASGGTVDVGNSKIGVTVGCTKNSLVASVAALCTITVFVGTGVGRGAKLPQAMSGSNQRSEQAKNALNRQTEDPNV